MSNIKRFFALFLLTFLATNFTRVSQPLASVIINENFNQYDFYQNITKDVKIAESSEELKLEKNDLYDQDILSFNPIDKPQVSLPYSRNTRWFKFEFKNQTDEYFNKFLTFDAAINGTIFILDQNGKILDKIGSSVPGSSYTTQLNIPFYPVELAPRETKTFFWALRTRHNVSGEFALTSLPHYANKDNDYIIMFYTGGILSLFFFNLLTYIFTREQFYKSYLIYIGSFLIFILNIKGKLDQWIHIPQFTFAHYLICFSAILTIATLHFTHNFLTVKIKNKSHDLLYKLFIVYFSILGIIGITPAYEYLAPFPGYAIDIGIMLASTYMITMGFLSLKSNKVYATIFLLSWSFIFIGVFTWFGMKADILPSNIITDNILLFASLLEMSTLSLGISIRQLEWQKEKSLISQKAAEKEKFERLLRVLTHDLANPLTLILANSKRLLVRDELTFQHPSLEKIYLGAENMKRVLTKVREEELLNISSSDISRSNIVEALNYSLIFFEEQLQRKLITVELNLNKEIYLDIDRTILINNIFNNIFSNAIKFSHFGGKIKITALTTNQEIIVEFRDYGLGVSPEVLSSFMNSENIQSTKGTFDESGSGFGLRLIRDYMKKFGGSVEIISHQQNQDQNDQGTTVRLIFPKVLK